MDMSGLGRGLKVEQSAFRSASPFPHAVQPGFLSAEQCRALIGALEGQTWEVKSADLFHFSQTKDFKDLGEPTLVALRQAMLGLIEQMSKATGLKLRPGVIDMHATLYQDADFLLCHDDQLEGRKIAWILYLSDLEKGDGGALELYEDVDGEPTTIAKRLVPKTGSLTFFEVSDKSFHAVSELVVDKKRYAIAGWYHG